jgi:NADH:ubiquinone oxidoreductase subunit 3 (subunit A)
MAPPIPVQTSAGLEPAFELNSYLPVFVYLGGILLFAVGAVAASQLLFLKPRKNTAVKLMPYESGVDPIGSARMQFDIKFYLIAILFLVFDVELLFLYPWAVIAYADGGDAAWRAVFGRIVFWEIIVFIVTLAIAYVYAWRKGVFQWR